MARDWDESYATGDLPWDTGIPSPELVSLVEAGRLPRGRALDIGCGTGTNARYLASQGYEVVGVDVSHHAVKHAAKEPAPSGSVTFQQLDFLAGPPPGTFDLIFDRGCFHVFDDPAEQARFATHVAGCLSPRGLWLSLIGSTEGPARDEGPPRRSAQNVVRAVEPALEIVELRRIELDTVQPDIRAWVLMAKPREVPAQPSTAR